MYTIEINYKSEKELDYESKMNELKEKWKPIIMDGIEFDYKISNTGKIKNNISGKILAEFVSGKNYKRVVLYHKGIKYKYALHRLVAIHFVKIPNKYIKKGYTEKDLVPNHLDGIKNHNAVFNLEWTTPRDNTRHAYDTGLADISIGENSHLAKMTNKQAIEACELLSNGWTVSGSPILYLSDTLVMLSPICSSPILPSIVSRTPCSSRKSLMIREISILFTTPKAHSKNKLSKIFA